MWLNKRVIYILFLLLSSQLKGQLLWKITSQDGSKKLYLFGTMHLPMGDYVQDHPTVRSVLEKCDCLYTETSLDQTVIAAIIDNYIYLPEGVRVQDSLSEMEWNTLDSLIGAWNPMFSASMFNQFKPMYLSALLAVAEMQKMIPDTSGKGLSVDQSFLNYAESVGIPNKYLETQEEQLHLLFNSIPLTQQFEMLRKSLMQHDSKDSFILISKRLPFLYQEQKLDSISIITNFTVAQGIEEQMLYEILLDKRNLRWMDEIMKVMAVSDETLFIAVGAGHLTGPHGLLNLMRKQGYKVEPVNFD